jgi:hypothetical protein
MPFRCCVCTHGRGIAFSLAVSMLLAFTVAAPAQVTFSKETYPTGLNPVSVFSDDFNGDGRKDIAIALRDESKLEIRYGQADSSFSAGVQAQLCGFPTKVLAADLNRDGLADLVVLTDPNPNLPKEICGSADGGLGGSVVEVILGSSTGGTPTVHHFGTPAVGFDLALGDLNNDGVLDIASLPQGESISSILLNFENPDATAWNYSSIETSFAPHALALGDFNADGNADLVMTVTDQTHTQGRIYIMTGRGDGSFVATAPRLVDAHPGEALVSGDLNVDGRLDLVAMLQACPPNTGCDSSVAAYLNQGSTFLKIPVWSSSSSNNAYINPRSPVIGDFSGDGHKDIAFLVTDQRFETGGDYLFVVPLFSNNTAGAVIKYFLGFDQGVRALAWTRIAGTSSLPDLVSINVIPNTFAALTNTTSSTGGSSCSPPDTVSVNVCGPTSGSVAGNQVRVQAAASVLDRAFRLEIWEGSSKLFTARDTNQLDTKLSLTDGIHTLTFVARNENNTSRATNSVGFTVGDGRCPVPATNGINVCLPANNSTVSAHVAVKAAAKLTEGIYRFEVWIDGVKQTFVRNGNLINYLITLDAGLHRFEFVAYNLSGTSRVTKTVRATVR